MSSGLTANHKTAGNASIINHYRQLVRGGSTLGQGARAPRDSLVAPQIQKLADRSDVISEVSKCSKIQIFGPRWGSLTISQRSIIRMPYTYRATSAAVRRRIGFPRQLPQLSKQDGFVSLSMYGYGRIPHSTSPEFSECQSAAAEWLYKHYHLR